MRKYLENSILFSLETAHDSPGGAFYHARLHVAPTAESGDKPEKPLHRAGRSSACCPAGIRAGPSDTAQVSRDPAGGRYPYVQDGGRAVRAGLWRTVRQPRRPESDPASGKECWRALADQPAAPALDRPRRDPFAAEIESNFGEKVLGNFNTEHIIKPPEKMKGLLGLLSRTCAEDPEYAGPISEPDINRIKLQVPGWRVEKDGESSFKLVQDFKARRGRGQKAASGRQCMTTSLPWSTCQAKDAAAMKQMVERFEGAAAKENGYKWESASPVDDQTLRLVLRAGEAKTITFNDFILAAKLNQVPVTDLAPAKKKRFWA